MSKVEETLIAAKFEEQIKQLEILVEYALVELNKKMKIGMIFLDVEKSVDCETLQ